jgi:hypothetical protein
MAVQASTKRGVKSTSIKASTTRHGIAPAPRTRPVTGAFGREGADRQTPRSAGPLRRRIQPRAARAATPRGAVGISNLSPERERREQRRLPPRGQRRGR